MMVTNILLLFISGEMIQVCRVRRFCFYFQTHLSHCDCPFVAGVVVVVVVVVVGR